MPISSALSPNSWPRPRTLSTVMRPCCALKQSPIWAGLTWLYEYPPQQCQVTNQKGRSGDDAIGLPQADPHAACHLVGWLDRGGRCLPRSRNRRVDQPRCTHGACRLSGDGANRPVRYRSVGSCLARKRTNSIAGHSLGLFRHYWVLVKLSLTIFATIVLLEKTPVIGYAARRAVETALSSADLSGGMPLAVHASGGILVLLVVTALSVYKPWGLTAYGRRMQQEGDKVQGRAVNETPDN